MHGDTPAKREITLDWSNPLLFNPVYLPTFNVKEPFIHYFGSAGSGKSHFVAQKEIIFSYLQYRKNRKTLVCRRFYNTIEHSCYALLKNVIYDWGLEKDFHFTKSPYSIVNLKTGVQFVFVGLDDVEKVKSIARVDRGWIEEATEMRSADDLEQLSLRLRGFKNVQWTLSYNPTSVHHWINKTIHEKRPPGHFILKTTYKDNIRMPEREEYGRRIEMMKTTNPSMYRVYGLGLWGLNTQGLIYPNLGNPVPEMPDIPQAYCLDIGFNDPIALCKIAIHDEYGKPRKQLYAEQILYQSGLDTGDFMKEVEDRKLSKRIPIVYDPAGSGPLFDKALREAGYWTIAADKTPGSVERGIGTLKKLDINLVAGSKDMFREFENYSWKNKNGELLDIPQDGEDHSCDAVRYGVMYLENPSESGSQQFEEW